MPLFLKPSVTTRGSSTLLLAILVLLHGNARADLGSYEKAATQPRKEKSKENPAKSSSPADEDDDCDREQHANTIDLDCTSNDLLGEILFYPLILVGEGMGLMAEASMERETGSTEEKRAPMPRRKRHDRDIPRLALDLNLHRLDADTYGTGIRLESGWGPVGLEADTLRYRQHDPAASLAISHVHFMLRGSWQDVQLNLGVGGIYMNGQENNSGPSLLTTLSLFPNRTVAIDLRANSGWINGNHLADYDGSLALGRKGYALRTGYRYSTANKESLHGPYIGLSWRY